MSFNADVMPVFRVVYIKLYSVQVICLGNPFEKMIDRILKTNDHVAKVTKEPFPRNGKQ